MKTTLAEAKIRQLVKNAIKKCLNEESMMGMATPFKSKLIEAIEEEMVDPKKTALDLVEFMSEEDAHRFIRIYFNGTEMDSEDDEL